MAIEDNLIWKRVRLPPFGVEGGGVTESVFSSREHNVNVFRLKATGQRKINLVLGLKETPGREGVL